MVLLGNNVLLAEAPKDMKSTGGIILTADTSKASKVALILDTGAAVSDKIRPNKLAYIDWVGALPVEYKGIQAVIIDADKVKAVFDKE